METSSSVYKMNDDIVAEISEKVPDEPGVSLWNLGDVFYGPLFSEALLYGPGPQKGLKDLVDAMKGNHRTLKLVLGNHDYQFGKFTGILSWSTLRTQEIFLKLGFDEVYDRPVLFGDKLILSHEPVFLGTSGVLTNVHGHTHQTYVGRNYFQWEIENREMVKLAFERSGRPLGPWIDKKKKNWMLLETDPAKYINVCWDAKPNRITDLDLLLMQKRDA